MQFKIKKDFQNATAAYIAAELNIDEEDIDNDKLNAIMQQLADKAVKLYTSIP